MIRLTIASVLLITLLASIAGCAVPMSASGVAPTPVIQVSAQPATAGTTLDSALTPTESVPSSPVRQECTVKFDDALRPQYLPGVKTAKVTTALGEPFTLTYNAAEKPADYTALACANVPLSSSYAKERGADKGLIQFPLEANRQAMEYAIPAAHIRARVHATMDTPERRFVDVLILRDNVTVVETFTANAGMFVASNVYVLPADPGDKLKDLLGEQGQHLVEVVAGAIALAK